MKLAFFLSLLLCSLAHAEIKISQLPLGSASSAGISDSFPYVNASTSTTQRLTLYDIINLPPFQTQFALMIPSQIGQTGKCLGTNGSVTSWVACGSGGGGVTSVGLSAPAWLTVGNSPITGSGTIALTGTSQSANVVLASPNGTTGALTPRALVAADLPAISLATGVTGNLPVTNLNSGTSASSSTFWRGDGSWSSVAWGGITGTLSAQSDLNSALALLAPLASPTFTGTVTVPLGAGVVKSSAGGVLSVSNVSLATQVTGNLPVANLNSGTSASSSTFWRGDGTWAAPSVAAVTWGSITGTLSSQTDLNTALGLLAPIASPTFTGTVTVPLGAGVVKSSAGGVLSVSNVSLSSQVTGNLPVANLNSGTSASSTTFWRGDATWASPSVAWGAITGTLSSQTDLNSALVLLAPLASPTFTGTVTVSANKMLLGTSGNLAISNTTPFNALSTGLDNTCMGTDCLNGLTSANFNTAFGWGNLKATVTGNNNTAVGAGNMPVLTSGANNVGVGFSTLSAITSSANNTCVGLSACDHITTGTGYNVVIGANASAGASGVSTGTDNTVVGGNGAGASIGTGSGNIMIGSGANTLTTSASNQLNIGGTNAGGVTNGVIGNGWVSTTPASFTLNITGGSGSNVAGGTLTLAGGKGTGTGVGGDIIFKTAPAGSTGSSLNSLVEGMRLDTAGNVSVGTGALSTSATTGFLYIPTTAGTPTGVPGSKTGLSAMVIDTTNNKICFYNGAWKCAAGT